MILWGNTLNVKSGRGSRRLRRILGYGCFRFLGERVRNRNIGRLLYLTILIVLVHLLIKMVTLFPQYTPCHQKTLKLKSKPSSIAYQ